MNKVFLPSARLKPDWRKPFPPSKPYLYHISAVPRRDAPILSPAVLLHEKHWWSNTNTPRLETSRGNLCARGESAKGIHLCVSPPSSTALPDGEAEAPPKAQKEEGLLWPAAWFSAEDFLAVRGTPGLQSPPPLILSFTQV